MEKLNLQLTTNHVDHDNAWLLGADDRCLACIVEIMEGTTLPSFKKKRSLAELLSFLQSSAERKRDLLNSDLRVTTHVVLLLLGRPMLFKIQ